MGYGEKLKYYLDESGMSVNKLSTITGISSSTLYSIIKRDSAIRYDFAFRIANVLHIPVSEICSTNPFEESGEEVLPPSAFPDEPELLTKLLADNRSGVTAKYHLRPYLTILGIEEHANVEQLLSVYTKLSDDGRKALFDFLTALEKNFTDPRREKEVAKIIDFKGKIKNHID